MTIADVLTTIEQSSLANWVGGNVEGTELIFPVIETFHVLAVAIVFGSIFLVDMRLLGIVARNRSAARFLDEHLRWTWIAFLFAAATGLLMFCAHATTYWDNAQFRYKLLLIFLAGCNMLVFNTGAYQKIEKWADQQLPPPAARVAGLFSVVLWIGVVVMGRWIGFTT